MQASRRARHQRLAPNPASSTSSSAPTAVTTSAPRPTRPSVNASTTKDTVRDTPRHGGLSGSATQKSMSPGQRLESANPSSNVGREQKRRPHRGEPNRASRTCEAPEPLTCRISCRASEGGPEAPDAGPSPQRVGASEPVLEPSSRPGVTAFLERTTGLPAATCGRSRRGTCSAGRADLAVLPILP